MIACKTTSTMIATLALLLSTELAVAVDAQRLRQNNNLRGGGRGGGQEVPISPQLQQQQQQQQQQPTEATTPIISHTEEEESTTIDTNDNNALLLRSRSPKKMVCDDTTQQLFQLELHTDDAPCETSWTLERITDEEIYYIDGQEMDYFDESDHSTRCLDTGKYSFTIHDMYGDGIVAPGYYRIMLDGVVLAEGGDFGYEETTEFTVGVGGGVADELRMSASPTESPSMAPSTGTPTDRPTESPTLQPTTTTKFSPSEMIEEPSASDNASSAAHTTSSSTTTTQEWTTLFDEDFEHSLNQFHAGSISDNEYITYYPFVKERRGVVRLQNSEHNSSSGSSSSSKTVQQTMIYSDNIPIMDTIESYEEIKISFSFYAHSMEGGGQSQQLHNKNENDGFCLDYSIDDGMTWHTKQCYHAIQDFDNDVWYDNVGVSFNMVQDTHLFAAPSNGDGDGGGGNVVEGMRLRFRCKTNSLNDDVLLDRVVMLGLAKQTHLKDSI